jgi:hypothetical protein
VPSGYLTFVREGRLFAVAFDVERLELTGSPVPVLEEVRTAPTTGGAQFAFSNDGTAVYRVGATVARQMTWIEPAGIRSPLSLAAADWSNMRFFARRPAAGARLARRATDRHPCVRVGTQHPRPN